MMSWICIMISILLVSLTAYEAYEAGYTNLKCISFPQWNSTFVTLRPSTLRARDWLGRNIIEKLNNVYVKKKIREKSEGMCWLGFQFGLELPLQAVVRIMFYKTLHRFTTSF